VPNLFRVDFYQGKTDAEDYGQVKHSLVDTATDRKIISLTISGDKLQSVSNYTREPKRLVFECFPTTWIMDNILSGSNEYERYISHYEVKVYRDGVVFFTGIIDTSQLSFDESSGIMKIMCYDKIKLLSVFSNLTHYYSLTAGYLPIWILGYFLQDIQQTIPISIPYRNQFEIPNLYIPSDSSLKLVHLDYDDMLPTAVGGWEYSFDSSGWPAPFYGYRVDVLSNTITFVFAFRAHIKAVHQGYATQYQAKFRGRIYRFYNGICPVMKEYEEKSEWNTDPSTFENAYNEFLNFFSKYGINQDILMNGLSGCASLDRRSYNSGHYIHYWVEAECYGYILPSFIHPGKSYETYKQENTDNLKVLQAMLMMYNATIFTNEAGQIILKNKDAYATDIIDIADEDVISFITKRVNQETPDTSVIEVLAGDTTHLASLIKDYLIGFHNGKWSCEATIDQIGKYNLALQSKICIQGVEYAITEIERDYVNDEYKVKAWRI
jgi:hypothetical protein